VAKRNGPNPEAEAALVINTEKASLPQFAAHIPPNFGRSPGICGLRAAPSTPQFLAVATPATAVVYSDASWANLNLNRLGKGGDWNYKKRRRRPDGQCKLVH
jgi:hypothetical protein